LRNAVIKFQFKDDMGLIIDHNNKHMWTAVDITRLGHNLDYSHGFQLELQRSES
jgi:hypothetical protein